jgi:dienelactone hydrolase
MRIARIVAIGVAVLASAGAGAYFNREPLMLGALASKTPQSSLAERMALLTPDLRVFMPEGANGPLPAIMMFHGCSGRNEAHMRQFADLAVAQGYAAFSFDSLTPRGIDRETALATVCKGEILIGQERAGDIAAAFEIVRQRSDIDPERIVIAGWSHGGWTAMDYLTFAIAGRKAPGVGDAPTPTPTALVLFYPYCGEGARGRFAKYDFGGPMIAFIAGKDEIVDGPQCRAMLEKAKARGADVEIVYYEDANHVFDFRHLEGADRRYYSESSTIDAEQRFGEFLSKVAAQ